MKPPELRLRAEAEIGATLWSRGVDVPLPVTPPLAAVSSCFRLCGAQLDRRTWWYRARA
jgi:hypothetical protein